MNFDSRSVFVFLVVGLASSISASASTFAQPGMAEAAAKFRTVDQPVEPLANGSILAEAEEFAVAPLAAAPVGEPKVWQAKNYGENYYCATFANCFLSRKAFLAAPEACDETLATISVKVPAAGRYLALVRYEACYRFETQFTLKIEQGGAVVFTRMYGGTANPKVWAFSEKVKPQVAWPWGAVENIVWEGHDAAVDLQAGTAKLTLIAGKQPEPAAKRHVDCVLLTPNIDDVQQRIEKESYLPLDGLLTQEGDVFLRLSNRGATKLALNVPAGTEHSPYWIHQRAWKPQQLAAEPGQTTDWVEVGSLLDSLNDGQWHLTAAGAAATDAVNYVVELAAKNAGGATEKIAEFPSQSKTLRLVYFGDTRYRRSFETQEDVLYDLLDYLKKQPRSGKPVQRTLVYAYTFDKLPADDPAAAKYNAAVDEFIAMFNLATTDTSRPGTAENPRGYIDVRGEADLEAYCQKLKEQGLADKIAVVSLGDEIGLALPPADDHAGFRAWLAARGHKPADVVPSATAWEQVNYSPAADRAADPRGFYFSKLYQHHVGVEQQKARTDILKRHLPRAGIGANYSPHHGNPYLGEVHQWITLFRRGGMTMPWSEDYIWGVPVGSQQMNFICLDMFRAALKGQPDAKMMQYVMPHWPGNTPASWRRMFYGSIAHGVKHFNLFEFRPMQAAYTENYVNLPEMYVEVRNGLDELATFEDIVQDGQVQPAQTALWFSETSDIWDDNAAPFAAAKRCLYVAIRHQQVPLDFVIDEDALAGDLKNYKLLFLTDRHVSRAASEKIKEWVESGGRLVATAGAGLLDEFNQPNDILIGLYGITPGELETPAAASVVYAKQDLPFSEPLDTVKFDLPQIDEFSVPIYAARQKFTASPNVVVETFADGSPAILRAEIGKGEVKYCGFLPGLSYFRPAMPKRPVDRGTIDDCMAHFVPREFDEGARALVWWASLDAAREVHCSQQFVESTVIKSPHGVAIPLVNWSGGPIRGLKVMLSADIPAGKITLASGRPVEVIEKEGARTLKLDLDVADAIIIR